MQNHKKKVRIIIGITAGIWFLSLAVFLVVGRTAGDKWRWYPAAAAYGIWNLLLFGGAYLLISRDINQVLGKIADCIQSMIDGEPAVKFAVQEESLTGKFQMQILKLYQILNDARERERKASRQMSELVADLVHQVNTPLTNIQMYCGFLTQDSLSQKEREDICRTIDSQVEKLGWFADGFTKTIRMEDDIRRLEPCRQPVLNMVLSAIDQTALKANRHENEICLSGEQDIEAVYDRRWTEEALFNVLDNAVKYGERGTPIQVTMEAYDLFVRIDVTNSGTPIPREEYTRIFQRFYRGKNAALIKDGVGLGLYLARQIISQQGGYMKVESKNDGKHGRNTISIFLKKEEE